MSVDQLVEVYLGRGVQHKAPTLSPLNRVMGRAALAEQRRSSQTRVMNSLPPMLAQTTGKRWVGLQADSLQPFNDNTVKPLKEKCLLFALRWSKW